jgi:hypothetical protein
MFAGFILVATILLALAFGILTGWGVLTAFLYAIGHRNLPKSPATPAVQPHPSTT